MKILVLGADGMLGHQLVKSLRSSHEVAGTVRRAETAYAAIRKLLPDRLFASVDTRNFSGVEHVIATFAPDAVINAVGIVKQRTAAKDAIDSIKVNALLPHQLGGLCARSGVRLVHLSTDCVFSGRAGNYSDDANHDASDLYGRTKSLGEVEGPGVLTLRTSIIGLELTRGKSLIEWYLSQTDEILGFRRAIYSGLTTIEIARVIERLLSKPTPCSGIYNLSSEPIDKFSLLSALNERLGSPLTIRPDDTFECDRSLDSTRFRATFGYKPPSWEEMLDELADQIRKRAEGRA